MSFGYSFGNKKIYVNAVIPAQAGIKVALNCS